MSWKSRPDRYGRVAVIIHWLSTLLILGLLASGFRAAGMVDPAAKATILRIHVTLGLSVTALTLARLGWWLVDTKPAMAAGTRPFWDRAARTAQALFYVGILGMAASGSGMLALSGAGLILFASATGSLPDFWAYAPRGPHGFGAWALLTLFALHAGAALYHRFVQHYGLLRRMAFS